MYKAVWMLVLALATQGVVMLASSHGAPLTALAQDDPGRQEEGDGPNREELLESLAEARVLMQVERSFGKAERVIDRATTELEQAMRTQPDEWLTMYLAALSLKAELCMHLGRSEEAFSLLEDVVKRCRAAGIAVDPDVERMHSQLVAMRGGVPEEGAVALLIRDAAQTHNFSLISQLGRRAVPALEKILLEQPLAFPSSSPNDLFTYLIQADQGRAARFVLEHLNHGGVLWKGRIVRAMGQTHVIQGRDAWDQDSGYPAVCLRPDWLSVLEVLIRDADVGPDALRMMAQVFYYGSLTPELRAGLIEVVRSGDRARKQAFFETLSEGTSFRVPALREVLEAGLGSPDSNTRLSCALRLLNHELSPRLTALYDDPDPRIRTVVARSLGKRKQVLVHLDHLQKRISGSRSVEYQPPLGDLERKAVAELAQDPDPQVRDEAVNVLWNLPTPIEEGVYLKLAEHADPGIRRKVAGLTRVLPMPLQSRVLEVVALDPDPDVTRFLDSIFSELPWKEHPVEMARYLLLRYSHPTAPPYETGSFPLITTIVILCENDEARRLLVEYAVNEPDDVLLGHLTNEKNVARLKDLPADLLLEVLQRAYVNGAGDVVRVVRLLKDEEAASARRRLYRAAKDLDLDPGLRLILATLGAGDGHPDFGSTVVGLLRDPRWKSDNMSSKELGNLHSRLKQVGGVDANEVTLAIVSEDLLGEAWAQAFLYLYEPRTKFGKEIGLSAVHRWLQEGSRAHFNALAKVIEHAAFEPDLAATGFLRRAVRTDLRDFAVETMGRMRRPEDLPLLAGLLAETSAEESTSWRTVVNAIVGYMNDDAAQVLLDAAGRASSPGERAELLGSVDSIRVFLDARERWSARSVGRQSRDDSVVELLAMLDESSPEVRREAVRALATLDAVEVLPRLIRMLKDPDATVVSEVRKALDHLNRPQGDDE